MSGQLRPYVYRDDDPRYPEHLKAIKEGRKKSTGLCKVCAKSAAVQAVSVELPKQTYSVAATDDENGYKGWEYPDGEIIVYDDGAFEWRSYGINHGDPSRLRDAAAALLAAAEASERSR